MRRGVEINVQRILCSVFCKKLAVSVPCEQGRPASADMECPRGRYCNQAVKQGAAENPHKQQREKFGEAAAPCSPAEVRDLPGEIVLDEFSLLLLRRGRIVHFRCLAYTN